MRHIRQRSLHHVKSRSSPLQVSEAGGEADLPAQDTKPEEGFRIVGGADVRTALARLPREQRQAIELAFFGGCTYGEIAVQLGIPAAEVLTHLRLGLHAFGSCLPASSEQEDS